MGALASIGVVGAVTVAGVAILCNMPTNPFVKKPEKATIEYLEQSDLEVIGGERTSFKASDLWKENGAVIFAVRRPG